LIACKLSQKEMIYPGIASPVFYSIYHNQIHFMSVTLIKRTNRDGTKSLFLDIYHDGRYR